MRRRRERSDPKVFTAKEGGPRGLAGHQDPGESFPMPPCTQQHKTWQWSLPWVLVVQNSQQKPLRRRSRRPIPKEFPILYCVVCVCVCV